MTLPGNYDDIKNRVREAADIVQVIGECVELKKAGVRFTGLCPFHAEKTPSFSVNPQGQFFHCFGCGESGDVFSFVMKYHHMGFPEALKELARRYHIDLPQRRMTEADQVRVRQREELYRVNEEVAVLYQQRLFAAADGAAARAYLQKRGVPEEIIKQYRLGFAPGPETAGWSFICDMLRKKKLPIAAIERAGLAVKKERGGHYDRFRDRVQFPIIDMTGRVVAFGGRILGDGKPKYMNSPESPVFDKSRLLFGLFQHREAIRKSRRALVVEGNFDLLLLAVHGIDNVVAPLGTALTRNHVRSLRGYCDEVVLLFDGDSAGLKAAMRSVPYFLAEQVEGRVALLPEGHDPDTLVREKGPEGIERLVNGAQPLAEFVFDTLVREHGLTLSGKNKIISELHQLVRDGEDSSQRSLMVAHFSDKLGVSPSQFKVRPAKAQRPAAFEQGQQRLSLDQLPRRQRQLVDFLILYPEFLAELQAVDLASVIDEVAALEIIDHLARLSKDGPCAPEQLMSVVTGERERNYVAELLMRESANDEEHRAGQARRMCNELLAWLRDFQDRRCGADLQCQINEAQRVGDTELLMELLRRKQEAERKRTGF